MSIARIWHVSYHPLLKLNTQDDRDTLVRSCPVCRIDETKRARAPRDLVFPSGWKVVSSIARHRIRTEAGGSQLAALIASAVTGYFPDGMPVSFALTRSESSLVDRIFSRLIPFPRDLFIVVTILRDVIKVTQRQRASHIARCNVRARFVR